jgi:diaminohydroxyphosphoribosylaminopyrimidine deaminase / 5-amino-6-(5-phosphoribosylamino)uracil reductase
MRLRNSPSGNSRSGFCLSASEQDEALLRMALALGRRHLGRTAPNPAVGAVVVSRSGLVVGTGTTATGGRPHAERLALEQAGEAARGGCLYVTLEPCVHHGKTPPCTEAILASGIARVVCALRDPDPRVAGKGYEALRKAGLTVVEGCLKKEARRDHLGHLLRITHQRPMLTLKLAQTQDGYAGRREGQRLMISGEEAFAFTHRLRAHHDAILVGIGTVESDDPRLDVRLPGLEERSPLPIVIDSSLRITPSSRLVQGTVARPLWVITTQQASKTRETDLHNSGVHILRVTAQPDGRVCLKAALKSLATYGLTRLLCEGGPTLAASLMQQDLVDQFVLITASRMLEENNLKSRYEALPALTQAMTVKLHQEFTCYENRLFGEDKADFWECHSEEENV